ncbi:hypothetical protein LCD52_12530 [Rossellomorea vietnamensis]|uniref:hypothetical protein n=1 Tax=Rossellomorea TaxID=2837508 RepID=UPI001CCD778C|nr:MULTISPECIES: hypothetical protein [Rossellomorea]MCA0149621.1 hypothetical protein [Rossellomorea vietnamensis]UTE78537.1 hypothetical protein M1J35_07185 [Rossellomorea sp. KS-H15a]
MKKEASAKNWNTFRNITLVIILFIFVRYLFDEDPTNDRIGWSVMIVFWISKGLFDAIEDKRNGNKKSMVANIVFVIGGFGVLLWQGMKVIF